MKAIQINVFGGPDVLHAVNVEPPVVKPNEVLIQNEFVGINMVDTYWRKGLKGYRAEFLPVTLGMEGGGRIVAVGAEVGRFQVGDRVVGVMHQGSYAEYWAVPETKVALVPDQVSMDLAVGIALQGFTAYFLSHWTWNSKPGDLMLVQAAAGGVGGLLARLASLTGARVIGTCSSTFGKRDRALACGCSDVIVYDRQDFCEETLRLTGGLGVDVVFDSVGLATFRKGLECIKPRGLMCLFGQSSGEVEPIDPQVLRKFGSLYLTRPTLSHYIDPVCQLDELATKTFDLIDSLSNPNPIAEVLTFEEVVSAHQMLEGRLTSGKLIVRI